MIADNTNLNFGDHTLTDKAYTPGDNFEQHFHQAIRNHLATQPLELFLPSDLDKIIDSDPKDKTGFWVTPRLWIEFEAINEEIRRALNINLGHHAQRTIN